MTLKSPLSQNIVENLALIAPPRTIDVLSEVYQHGGTIVFIQVDALKIKCVGGSQDFSVSIVAPAGEVAVVPMLYAFFERGNSLDASIQLLKSMANTIRQVTWLVENFNRIYTLLCDPAMCLARKDYLAFQEALSEEYRYRRRQEFIDQAERS
jgi:hypothetical protein